MYLEISGRQTGKTTRLIQKAQEFLSLDDKHSCLFFVLREQIGKMFKNYFLEGFKQRVTFVSSGSSDTTILHAMRGISQEKTLFVVDEFDFIPGIFMNTIVENLTHGLDNLAVATTMKTTKTFKDYRNYIKNQTRVDWHFWRFMEETDFKYHSGYEETSFHERKFATIEKQLELTFMEKDHASY